MYPQNALQKKGFVSIGCALVQEPSADEDIRADDGGNQS
jgi:hypothetical protein